MNELSLQVYSSKCGFWLRRGDCDPDERSVPSTVCEGEVVDLKSAGTSLPNHFTFVETGEFW
jgi:hypothetical protein